VTESGPAPSGEQLVLTHGDAQVVIVTVGGGIRTYAVGGRDILDGFDESAMSAGGRGQVLMPWPNRIAGGAYVFEGARNQLPLTEPANGNAIHGLVRWATWSVAEAAIDRTRLRLRLHPQPGYPFLLDLELEYALGADGLTIRTRARNVGPTRCPFGTGAHPYLSVGGAIDDATLRVPAGTVLHADERGIPVGRASVEGTAYDFRAARSIGPTVLDHCLTDLERDTDGRAWVALSGPTGATVRLWVDEAYRFLMLFTGDTLPDGGRHSLAVEPMTCAPNAFVSGDGLIVLEPGEKFEGTWGIVPRM
jgi:aldose 1-epimerase